MTVSPSYERRRARPGRPYGHWTPEEVLRALRAWAGEQGAPPRAYEWAPNLARQLFPGTDTKQMKWEREYPRWPSYPTVLIALGSWRAAMQEAGFDYLPPFAGTLRERVAKADALRSWPSTEVADLLGVNDQTVRNYWVASVCPECSGPKIYDSANMCAECAQRRPRETMRDGFDRATIVDALVHWTREMGQPPLSTDWSGVAGGDVEQAKWEDEFPRWPATHVVAFFWGSWNAAMIAAGLPIHNRRWRRQEGIKALQDWVLEHAGQVPKQRDFGAVSNGERPSATWYALTFGSWELALVAAGLRPYHRHRTDEQLLEQLLTFEGAHGHPPTWNDFDAYPDELPSASVLQRRFGGLTGASRRLGWPLPLTGTVTEQDCIEALQRWALEKGEFPSSPQWEAAKARPTRTTMRSLFGSWPAAVAAAQAAAAARSL